jgi:type VI secretion system secreted protein Hcp
MAVYMNFAGIKGDVTEEGHKDWIQCTNVSFSAFRDAETGVGAASQRQGKEVSIGEIHITKPLCAGSPHLFTDSVVGLGKKVQIHITRTGDTQQTNYLEITLDKACVSDLNVDSNGLAHSESLRLHFIKIEMKYLPVKPDGSPGEAIPVGFDIVTGAAC